MKSKKFERKLNYSVSSQSGSKYWAQIDKLFLWSPTLNLIWWISPIRPPKCVIFGSFLIDGAQTHSCTCRLWDLDYLKLLCTSLFLLSWERFFEPGRKGRDIGMQLTLTAVWVVNILPSFSVSLFLLSVLKWPLTEWVTKSAMKSNVKLLHVMFRYICHNPGTQSKNKIGERGTALNSPHFLDA